MRIFAMRMGAWEVLGNWILELGFRALMWGGKSRCYGITFFLPNQAGETSAVQSFLENEIPSITTHFRIAAYSL